MKLTKKKIKTIILTITLLAVHSIINYLQIKKIISSDPEVASIICVLTAIFVFFGCILQSFGHPKLSIVLGIIIFFGLCTCLFYATRIIDYVTFFICILIIMKRANNTCSCMGENNIFG